MRYDRYNQYPPEWDDEPEYTEYTDDADDVALLDDLEPDLETPWGTPADDVWHAQRAEDRDRFLHPPDPD